MSNPFGILGAILAGMAVAAGAFGAHILQSILSADSLRVFETGVRYHMYHALALCLVAIRQSQLASATFLWSGRFFATGIFLFSGSLYCISLTDMRWIGILTPLGGVTFLAGWSLLAIGEWKYQKSRGQAFEQSISGE